MRYSLKSRLGSEKTSQSLPDLSSILATTTVTNNLATLGGLNPEEREAIATGNATKEIY
nr:MAG TPA: hypothetical protein [Caudoviricetes sp.]